MVKEQDRSQGKGESKGKSEKGEETRVCHECLKLGHLRWDCSVYKKRMAEKVDWEKGLCLCVETCRQRLRLFRDQRRTSALMAVHLDQHVLLVMRQR